MRRGEIIAKQIATLLRSTCDEFGYPPTTNAEAREGCVIFCVTGEDGQSYAVSVAKVADLIGDSRQ